MAEETPVANSESPRKSSHVGDSQRGTPQENLLTKVINVSGRSYYLDVRENKRGEYLKLTEVSQNRRRTILLSGHLVGKLYQVLNDIIGDNFEEAEAAETSEDWTTIFSRRAVAFQKKIYFDLMKNKNGRSLNIAEVPQREGGRPKTAVIISEQGWLQLKRALEEIYEKYPVFRPPAPRGKSTQLDTKSITVGSKKFFLDLVENDAGRFLKISEIKDRRRDTVFIPDAGFEVLTTLFENLEKGKLDVEIEGLVESPPPAVEKEGQKTLLRRSFSIEKEDGSPADNRKFNLDYRENEKGKFLRIVEEKPGKSSAVFVPSEGFSEIRTILEEFANKP